MTFSVIILLFLVVAAFLQFKNPITFFFIVINIINFIGLMILDTKLSIVYALQISVILAILLLEFLLPRRAYSYLVYKSNSLGVLERSKFIFFVVALLGIGLALSAILGKIGVGSDLIASRVNSNGFSGYITRFFNIQIIAYNISLILFYKDYLKRGKLFSLRLLFLVILSVVTGAQDFSKSGAFLTLLAVFIPLVYASPKKVYFSLLISFCLALTVVVILIGSIYSSESSTGAIFNLLKYRILISQVEGFEIVHQYFMHQPSWFLDEVSRILYHAGLESVKYPLPTEKVFNILSGGNNIFGLTGFSSNLTVVGYGLYSMGYFGFLYVALVFALVRFLDKILKRAIAKNDTRTVMILHPTFITMFFVLPSSGMLLLSLESLIPIVLTQYLIIVFLENFKLITQKQRRHGLVK